MTSPARRCISCFLRLTLLLLSDAAVTPPDSIFTAVSVQPVVQNRTAYLRCQLDEGNVNGAVPLTFRWMSTGGTTSPQLLTSCVQGDGFSLLQLLSTTVRPADTIRCEVHSLFTTSPRREIVVQHGSVVLGPWIRGFRVSSSVVSLLVGSSVPVICASATRRCHLQLTLLPVTKDGSERFESGIATHVELNCSRGICASALTNVTFDSQTELHRDTSSFIYVRVQNAEDLNGFWSEFQPVYSLQNPMSGTAGGTSRSCWLISPRRLVDAHGRIRQIFNTGRLSGLLYRDPNTHLQVFMESSADSCVCRLSLRHEGGSFSLSVCNGGGHQPLVTRSADPSQVTDPIRVNTLDNSTRWHISVAGGLRVWIYLSSDDGGVSFRCISVHLKMTSRQMSSGSGSCVHLQGNMAERKETTVNNRTSTDIAHRGTILWPWSIRPRGGNSPLHRPPPRADRSYKPSDECPRRVRDAGAECVMIGQSHLLAAFSSAVCDNQDFPQRVDFTAVTSILADVCRERVEQMAPRLRSVAVTEGSVYAADRVLLAEHRGSCDISVSDCSTVAVRGFHFLSTLPVQCRVTPISNRVISMITSATYKSPTVVICRLPIYETAAATGSFTPTTWNIQVRSVGLSALWSDVLQLIVYDGDCVHCHLADNNRTSCTALQSSCNIAGVCFRHSQLNPQNPCQYCDGGALWSNMTDPGCQGNALVIDCSDRSVVCQHGSCVSDIEGATCVCESGYTGTQCQFAVLQPGNAIGDYADDTGKSQKFDDSSQDFGEEYLYSINSLGWLN